MHSRALYLVSILLLLFSLAGCSKKSDDAANSASQGQMNQGGSNTTGSNTSGSNTAGSNMAGSNAASAPAPQPVVIPAGTTLTVRLGEPVGSKISTTGQTFRATLAHDITVDGSTVISRGSSATGTVVDAKPLGRFKGGALLELRLTSMTVQGTEHRIQTAAMTTEEKGKGKRTAVMTGGGGALGAIIGGIAGGGKGAAIGAAAGAGAGVGGAAFTGNKEIVFPAESALSFKLRSPLEVTPRQ
jgi:hypothetical protein